MEGSSSTDRAAVLWPPRPCGGPALPCSIQVIIDWRMCFTSNEVEQRALLPADDASVHAHGHQFRGGGPSV